MITAIVFSRDRAMQLDLLLRSLDSSLFLPVSVIWHATSDTHRGAYGICRREHPDVGWAMERGGGVTGLARLLLENADLACFFTDDDVFYQRPVFDGLDTHALCHSFRLGRNTTFCYPLNRSQKVPSDMVWEWRDGDADFGYPGSLDGHVFRASHLRRALLTCSADANPNRLEEHLNRWCNRLTDHNLMTCDDHSSLVGIPANRVNETHPNRHGEQHHPDELAALYLEGKRLIGSRMDFTDVRGAHQEIGLVIT